jgi:hypothetical protein
MASLFSGNASITRFYASDILGYPISVSTDIHRGAYQGHSEQVRRCSIPGLSSSGWRIPAAGALPISADPVIRQLQQRDGDRIRAAAARSIEHSSSRTYSSGQHAFEHFAATHHLTTGLFTLTSAEIRAVIESFVLWLRDGHVKPLQASTIEQYLSHVNHTLKISGYPNLTAALHSPLVNQMIQGYKLEDAAAIPLRLRQRIPFAASILLKTDAVIDDIYRDPLAEASRLGFRAAYRIALGLALRTGEYVHDSTNRPGIHEARARNASFRFTEHGPAYRVSSPSLYPRSHTDPTKPAVPYEFILFLDHRKHSKTGNTLTLAASPPPGCQDVHLLQGLFDALYQYPPPYDGYLFDGIHPTMTANMLRGLLKIVAKQLHMDASRLTPHCARIGAKLQLTAGGASDTDALTLSGHASLNTERPYFRASPTTAHRIAPALQDPNAATPDEILFFFS